MKLHTNRFITFVISICMVAMSSNSLCMFISKCNRFCKTAAWKLQKRTFCSMPTISQEDYISLCADVNAKKKKLRLLKQDSSSNPKTIDLLQRDIDKKNKILTTCIIIFQKQ